MLHILTNPPSTTSPEQVIIQAAADDAILLMCDGVYWTDKTLNLETLACPIYAIEEHRQTRGLTQHQRVNYIGIDEMVDLTVAHQPIISW